VVAMEMEMIETPREVGGYLVRAPRSSASAEKTVVPADVISEPGIFEYALFLGGRRDGARVGWLVRTKGNEGGVAAWFSVLCLYDTAWNCKPEKQ
jgi:hypothetical protein